MLWLRSIRVGLIRPLLVLIRTLDFDRRGPLEPPQHGDLNQPGSEVARLVSTGDAQPLRGDLKLDFSVFYIKKNPASPEEAP